MNSVAILMLFVAFVGYSILIIMAGYRHGWKKGIGDAAEEYAKGYNLGVLETIKKLSEEE